MMKIASRVAASMPPITAVPSICLATAPAPLAIAGNTVLVPAGGPQTSKAKERGKPQLVAYTLP